MIDDIRESFEKSDRNRPRTYKCKMYLIYHFMQLSRIIGGKETKAIVYLLMNSKLFQKVDGYTSRGRIEEHYKRYKAGIW
jgi:hypothetical protein